MRTASALDCRRPSNRRSAAVPAAATSCPTAIGFFTMTLVLKHRSARGRAHSGIIPIACGGPAFGRRHHLLHVPQPPILFERHWNQGGPPPGRLPTWSFPTTTAPGSTTSCAATKSPNQRAVAFRVTVPVASKVAGQFTGNFREPTWRQSGQRKWFSAGHDQMGGGQAALDFGAGINGQGISAVSLP